MFLRTRRRLPRIAFSDSAVSQDDVARLERNFDRARRHGRRGDKEQFEEALGRLRDRAEKSATAIPSTNPLSAARAKLEQGVKELEQRVAHAARRGQPRPGPGREAARRGAPEARADALADGLLARSDAAHRHTPGAMDRRVRSAPRRATAPSWRRTSIRTRSALNRRGRRCRRADRRPARARARAEGLWAPHIGPEAGGTGPRLPRVRLPERGDRALLLGAARVRLPGAGRRQLRDPRDVRHAAAARASSCSRSSAATCAPTSR